MPPKTQNHDVKIDDFDRHYAMFFLLCMIFFSAISGIIVLVRFLLNKREMRQLRQQMQSNKYIPVRVRRIRSPGHEMSSLSDELAEDRLLPIAKSQQRIPSHYAREGVGF